MSTISGFLIVYNRRTFDRQVTEFPGANGPREALKQRLLLERERHDQEIEIASLNSDSIETIQRTHSRYFTGNERLVAI
ncbi:hypothetical protein OOZ51_08235 [Arthrobacter sp. MI7-26]|uniref:hypothetical protein n=1 Tax=Arthrobacter sp. MI7-26 TaxID=2993653 RepID=UPI0022489C1E|nr:hypothetical protein [Arthrobacter sp. MI7-26]MCX2747806.1 hypothetical protein [Arthrobacter sp. MI7-26]